MNMFKKVIAIMTASVLAASILVGCGGSTGASSSAPAEEKTEEAAPAEAAEPAAEAAAAADGDLASKKVGVCIYQFNDNFMTLYKKEKKEKK